MTPVLTPVLTAREQGAPSLRLNQMYNDHIGRRRLLGDAVVVAAGPAAVVGVAADAERSDGRRLRMRTTRQREVWNWQTAQRRRLRATLVRDVRLTDCRQRRRGLLHSLPRLNCTRSYTTMLF